MITCNLMGGLGNQLFQIFTTISYSIKAGVQFKFLNDETLGGGSCTQRPTYWNNFLSRMKILENELFKIILSFVKRPLPLYCSLSNCF